MRNRDGSDKLGCIDSQMSSEIGYKLWMSFIFLEICATIS